MVIVTHPADRIGRCVKGAKEVKFSLLNRKMMIQVIERKDIFVSTVAQLFTQAHAEGNVRKIKLY
jgi:hypothetical protein